jgi:hypothetical protein
MRKLILGAMMAITALPLAAPADAQRRDDDRRYDRRDDRGRDRDDWRRGRSYDWNRPDPRYRNYDAARYYHQGNYRERRLSRNDRIYRGNNGRYYCRRDDGTTGLLIGGVAGGVLGNLLSNGGSSTLATLLGAGGGALLGRSIDRGNVKCR